MEDGTAAASEQHQGHEAPLSPSGSAASAAPDTPDGAVLSEPTVAAAADSDPVTPAATQQVLLPQPTAASAAFPPTTGDAEQAPPQPGAVAGERPEAAAVEGCSPEAQLRDGTLTVQQVLLPPPATAVAEHGMSQPPAGAGAGSEGAPRVPVPAVNKPARQGGWSAWATTPHWVLQAWGAAGLSAQGWTNVKCGSMQLCMCSCIACAPAACCCSIPCNCAAAASWGRRGCDTTRAASRVQLACAEPTLRLTIVLLCVRLPCTHTPAAVRAMRAGRGLFAMALGSVARAGASAHGASAVSRHSSTELVLGEAGSSGSFDGPGDSVGGGSGGGARSSGGLSGGSGGGGSVGGGSGGGASHRQAASVAPAAAPALVVDDPELLEACDTIWPASGGEAGGREQGMLLCALAKHMVRRGSGVTDTRDGGRLMGMRAAGGRALSYAGAGRVA